MPFRRIVTSQLSSTFDTEMSFRTYLAKAGGHGDDGRVVGVVDGAERGVFGEGACGIHI